MAIMTSVVCHRLCLKVTHIVVCNFSPPKLSRCDEGSWLVASNKNTFFVFQQYTQLIISLAMYAFAVSVDNNCVKVPLVNKTKNNEKKLKKNLQTQNMSK